jgi:uncharacterized protein YbbC (DUF1343 family)
MKLGIEKLLESQMELIKGKRVGILTNMTGIDSKFRSTIDLLYQNEDVELVALFGPEHGIRGDTREGSDVNSYVDPLTNCPVYSLYGKTRKPKKEMLENLECIIVDIQDIGVRYYTYISTLGLLMEACMEQGKEVIVLDRPNPINGDMCEGNIIEKPYLSFVGLYPLPNRHSLTIGEIALLYKYEFGLHCDLTVVRMEGWKRSMFFRDTGLNWIQPSPNSTGESMNLLYAGMCLIEGTWLSEGRGTTRPFEVIGAPYIDGYLVAKQFNGLHLSGVHARPTSFIPTYSKYKDQLCFGVQIHVTDRNKVYSLEVGIHLLGIIAELYPDDFRFRKNEDGKFIIDLLAGHTGIKKMIFENHFESFVDCCHEDSENFKELRKPYLLYQ